MPAAISPARRRVLADAAWHSLLWLVIANSIGALIALMLILPQIDRVLAPWTYGRWMPVHMNLELYGWSSLPLVGFLFAVYGLDRTRFADWANPVLCVWSTALAVGCGSWLSGHSSGKLFLDWTGSPRVLFPLALATLWLLLTLAFRSNWHSQTPIARIVKTAGLALLAIIPVLLYVASSPTVYPPVNPDSGGPTGASQLESTLVIIAILLLVPYGLAPRKLTPSRAIQLAWLTFAIEAILCVFLGRTNISHHRPIQWISLGSLLVWIPLIPAYFAGFDWHPATRRWRIAFLCWWGALVPTGWALFLPGVLDHFKFTDGLVGHSLLAMAGFVSSLLIFVLIQLMGDDGWIFNGTVSFWVWNLAVVAYILVMFTAGTIEGFHPAFSMVPGTLRNTLYTARLLLGLLLLAASAKWFFDSFTLNRELEAA